MLGVYMHHKRKEALIKHHKALGDTAVALFDRKISSICCTEMSYGTK